MPVTALLAQLAGAVARLRYHGDFARAGLRIGNLVMRSFGAALWRFRAGDHAAAAREAPGEALTGAPVAASWDPASPPRCGSTASPSTRNASPRGCWAISKDDAGNVSGMGPRD